MRHGGSHAPLLLRSQLEYVIRQQLAMISLISVERRGSGSGENPLMIDVFEQSRGHRCARTDRLRIGNPALDPVRLQPFLGQKEIRSGSDFVVRGIARGMAFQARRRSTQNRLRAMSVSFAVSTGTCSGM